MNLRQSILFLARRTVLTTECISPRAIQDCKAHLLSKQKKKVDKSLWIRPINPKARYFILDIRSIILCTVI